MVHPYLRRREGLEKPEYPTPELEFVLGKTLGVPLFQEQAMQIAIVCAGFSPGEADQLRRSMATFKITGGVSRFHDQMIDGMAARGYPREFAERTFKQIEGFGSYGFPESHAASFALIAYASSWMKCHHPDIFCAALLNAQPMGFYAPAQIVRDACNHGVEILPVCVNESRWDSTLVPAASGKYLAVRLGLRMVKGLANRDAAALIIARADRGFTSIADAHDRTGIGAGALERLADADACTALKLSRREALWHIRALAASDLPLFAQRETIIEPPVALTPMEDGREVVEDYRSVGLTLRAHPLSFMRTDLRARRMITTADLPALKDGARLSIAGIVLVRQKPGSAGGVMFMTIEDEGGHANLVIWQSLFEKQRRLILSAGLVGCRGRLQREGEVMHVIAHELEDLTPMLRALGRGDDFRLATGRGDEARHGGAPDKRGEMRVPTRDFR
jgi:error-prone DNA polymerase